MKIHSQLNKPVAAPRFGNSAPLLLHRHASGLQKVTSKLVLMNEGGMGNAATRMIMGLTTVLLPKLLISRSMMESAEITFLEMLDHIMFYLAAPLSAGLLFHNMFTGIAKRAGRGFNPNLIMKSSAELAKKHPKELAKVLPVKAAIIMAAIGAVGIAGSYANNFARNLMTEKIFKVNRFSDIANLTAEKKIDNHQTSDVAKKSYRRLLQLGAAALLTLGAGSLLAMRGVKSKRGMEALKWFTKYFDFGYSKTAQGKIRFDLGNGQIAAIICPAIFSYVDAARDTLERIEVAVRAGTTGLYLSFWGGMLNTGILRWFGKRENAKGAEQTIKLIKDKPQQHWLFAKGFSKIFGDGFGKAVSADKSLKTIAEVDRECMDQALKALTKNKVNLETVEKRVFHRFLKKLPPGNSRMAIANIHMDKAIKSLTQNKLTLATVEKEAWKLSRPLLWKQNALYYAPILIGAVVVSGGMALLSRIMTANRFQRWVNEGKINQDGHVTSTKPPISEEHASPKIPHTTRKRAVPKPPPIFHQPPRPQRSSVSPFPYPYTPYSPVSQMTYVQPFYTPTAYMPQAYWNPTYYAHHYTPWAQALNGYYR